MGRSVRVSSALIAGLLAFVVGTPTAHAILNDIQYKCQAAIAKEAAKYFNSKLKLIQKCKDIVVAGGTCAAPDPVKLQKLVDKLNSGLAKKCSFNLGVTDDDNLKQLGFPGPCFDPSGPANGFTLADLQNCILTSHDRILEGVCDGGSNNGAACAASSECPGGACRSMVGLEYDPDVTLPIADARLKCQKEVAKNTGKLVKSVMSAVQKCRNGLLNCDIDDLGTTICKLSGFPAATCATSDPKTAEAITKARDKAHAAIETKCFDNADVTALLLCEPDQTDNSLAATCEVDAHQLLVDNPDPSQLSDLLDFQYATRGVCGDNRLNLSNEECDGGDDDACPGQCGDALGLFPCLCQNVPRSRIVEHANADLDNGWSGQSHDSGIVEGGGYVTDLFDCDGPGGSDPVCTTGPSCALPPHQSCSASRNQAVDVDTLCPGVGNFCRKTAGGAQGPHCDFDPSKSCRPTQNDCPTQGDRCITTPHGAPLPLVSGGVSVCVVNTFSEDVVGTTNLDTGEGAVRLRQDSSTYTGGDTQQPCPVCGGFCSGPGGAFGPATRNLCTSNADCGPGSFCVTENVCSWGPDIDKPCRPDTPFGGPTEYFGNPSVDCRMAGNLLGTIDILFNPASTSAVSRTANTFCNTPGFNNKVCAGGPNEHVPCTVDSECPGGTCNNQCFCPNTAGESGQKPNGCEKACLGGANDAQPCADDSECPPLVVCVGGSNEDAACTVDSECPGGACVTDTGFCHIGDCRVNPGDDGSAQEGLCTTGPDDGRCSLHPFVSCSADSGCRPSGSCPFCDESETCNPVRRQCFVNPTINRQGTPGVPDRTTAATFCITKTSSEAVNSVAGLSGPGAITNPTTVTNVGF